MEGSRKRKAEGEIELREAKGIEAAVASVLAKASATGSPFPLAPYSSDDEDEVEPRRNSAGNGRGKDGNGNGDWGEEEEDEEDDGDAEMAERFLPLRRKRVVDLRRDCPYLDTVNRQVLDFDFEKFCSISLTNLNVYACLVCGKYYQGRGLNSHAYTHSLEAGHHVYINLQTEKVYCLPDGYEINDSSLDDIRHVLNHMK